MGASSVHFRVFKKNILNFTTSRVIIDYKHASFTAKRAVTIY